MERNEDKVNIKKMNELRKSNQINDTTKHRTLTTLTKNNIIYMQ